MDQAQDRRNAYEQGVREERKRIAADMHDDVGARLLMLIHRAPTPDIAELSRAAMRDLRTAIATLDARAAPAGEALADWHAEAAARCEAAGVALDWQQQEDDAAGLLDAQHRSVLERVLRESVTNALKHAQSSRLQIDIALHRQQARLRIRNNGVHTPPEQWPEGHGTRGMRQRITRDGGRFAITALADGWVEVFAELPPRGSAA